MKLFSHKQETYELKTESEEDISVEDILAEYKAVTKVRYNSEPEPDGRGEYYSSSQGGADTYYDSESFIPSESYAPPSAASASDMVGDSSVDDLFNQMYAKYYEGPIQPYSEPEGEASDIPAAPQHSGKVGAMEQDALDYLADLRQQLERSRPETLSTEDLYAPVQEDERPYTPPLRYTHQSEEPAEIDQRFNLSGKRDNSGYFFGSQTVDTGADTDYTPSQQTDYNLSHWEHKIDPDSPEANDQDEEESKKGIFKKLHKKKSKDESVSEYETLPLDADTKEPQPDNSYSEGFRDYRAANNEYAQGSSYGSDYDDYDDYDDEDYGSVNHAAEPDPEADLPSFQEYVASLIASAFLRLRGTNRSVTNNTMVDTEEDLGQELTPAGACKYYGSHMRSQKLRLRIAAVMELILCYISLGLPIPGMLQNLQVSAAACVALQLAIMLLCLDVVTNAVLNASRLKFGVDGLAVISCLVTTLDGLLVALSDSVTAHTPLCAVSSLSLLGVMLASFLNTRGLRKTFRVPAIGRVFYAVTAETKLHKNELTMLKSLRPTKGFVRRTEEASPDETMFLRLAPLLLALAVFLSIIVAAVKHSAGDLVFIFSAILAPAAPFCGLLAFALPYFIGSLRIFRSGAAIAGWSGLCDIGASRNIIITDRDLFPEDSIELDSVRIFSDISAEKVIAYAGSIIAASGSSISGCFADLMEQNKCRMRTVENFKVLSGGGFQGIIEGHVVMCGSTELMHLMQVRIPYRLTDKTSVLLAIDGKLYGIFTLKYTPLPQVRRALVDMVRSGRHPVFAVRDFNVNPEMLHNTFDIATDGYDFPAYELRYPMTESSASESKIAAVICNEGLRPLTQVADVGRSMYVSIRLNVVVAALSALLGCLIVFVRLLSVGSVTVGFLLFFMLICTVPAIMGSLIVGGK